MALATPAQPATQVAVQTELVATGEGAPVGTAWPCHPTHARACDIQKLEGALPVGGVDRQNLRSVCAAVPMRGG